MNLGEGTIRLINVRTILSLKSFRDVYVKAGEAGLDNEVDNVFFMEVPDIFKYVDPGGLLLTTLYPIADNEEAIRSFIPNLVKQKVSCLAIKLGRYIHEVPPIMLKQADDYQIPLLILPNNANLSKLSNDILELFLGAKTSVLEYRDKIHGKLMSLLLEGADLQKLVYTVADLLSAPIFLVDEYFHIQTTSLTEGETVKMIRESETDELLIASASEKIGVRLNGVHYDHNQVVLQPILAGNENLGYLVAVPNENFDRSDLIIGLEQASMLCAFLFQKERAIRQNERNYLDSFIRDVLNNKFSRENEAIEKAKVFDWDLEFPVVVFTIEVLEENESRKREIYSELLYQGMIEQFIAQGLNRSTRSFKVVYYDEGLLCLIGLVTERDIEAKLHKVCSDIYQYYHKKYMLGFGISNPVMSVPKLHDAKEEAKLALDISKKLRVSHPFIIFYSQTGIYKLLHQINDPSVLHVYVEEKLGVLLKDNERETELLETLLCMLKNNFNLQKTAKELYIHYNTLRYRMDKLKEYGINTSDGLELAELAVAFQIYQYLQINKK